MSPKHELDPDSRILEKCDVDAINRKVEMAKVLVNKKNYGGSIDESEEVSVKSTKSWYSFDSIESIEDINMVKVTIVMGRGFKFNTKKQKNIPNFYCTIKFGASASEWHTSKVQDVSVVFIHFTL
jgi:hypothetical protein